MIIERDEKDSRKLIMLRLQELRSRGEGWVKASDVLHPCSMSGPWSDDLQNLVTEGVVVCQDTVKEMGPLSLVKLL